MIDYVLMIISLGGAFLVSSKSYVFYGFLIWIVANALWVIYYFNLSMMGSMLLFGAYFFIAIKGAYNNNPYT